MPKHLFFSRGLTHYLQNARLLTAVIESAGKRPVCSNFGDVRCDIKECLKESNFPYFL